MKVLVTGGSGFVGAAVVSHLSTKRNVCMRVPLRRHYQFDDIRIETPKIAGINDADWADIVRGQDVVIHLAGRAHVLVETDRDALSAFRAVNVEGTLRLARVARDEGVKRFVFLSSIGVNGSITFEEGFSERSEPAPAADYAQSKWEAEQALWELVANSDMELVVIRPPLVYAGSAPGNFRRLMRLVASGLPLPFGAVSNQRSLISLENLVHFIDVCVEHPAAANELFLIADGKDVSTPEIIKYVAEGMEKSPRLFPLPQWCLQTGARLIGKSNIYSQLCESLTINSSKARTLLGWQPVNEAGEALRRAGRDFNSFCAR